MCYVSKAACSNSDHVTSSAFSMWYVHFVHFIMSVMCLRWAFWFRVLDSAVLPGRLLAWVIYARATNGVSSCSSPQTLFSIGNTDNNTPITLTMHMPSNAYVHAGWFFAYLQLSSIFFKHFFYKSQQKSLFIYSCLVLLCRILLISTYPHPFGLLHSGVSRWTLWPCTLGSTSSATIKNPQTKHDQSDSLMSTLRAYH